MATAVSSRFAVFSIDEDDYKPKRSQNPAGAGKSNAKSNNKNDKQKQQPNKKDEKKKPSKSKKKKGNNDTQQWEQWKEKDSMAIEESYEQELHQAILLSKLAYEAQGTTKDTVGSKKIE